MWIDTLTALGTGLAWGVAMWLWQRSRAKRRGQDPRDPRWAWSSLVFGCSLATMFATRAALDHRGWSYLPTFGVGIVATMGVALGLTALGAALNPALRDSPPSQRDAVRR